MCGICGVLDLKQTGATLGAMLGRMCHIILHRGPDDEGRYVAPGVALGMRRLSIIDLSGGHQPITNEDETLWVINNGEIYNFQELMHELQNKGHVFRTKSDTEVLVHLYEQEGLDFVKRLRGMFALALWDAPRRRLVLARDRVGKKPLYLLREPHRLLFASEIKSILAADDVSRRIDHQALREYLALGYVPAPRTLFEGIEKVFPGHLLVFENGTVRDHEYWDAPFDLQEKRTEDEWVERVREKLLESVHSRLISDVPLGAFLSGGIDSSAVVAAMAQFSDRPIKTYSIGFEGADRFYNELPFAQVVAKAFNTDHHEIIVRPEVAELLPKLIWHLDEPIADSAFFTTYLVSRLARDSVTVILSGVGGDELFGGYRRYLGDALWRYYTLLPAIVRKKLLPSLLNSLPQDRHSGWKNNIRYASAFVKTAELDPVARYMSYVTVFPAAMRSRILKHQSVAGPSAADEPASEVLSSYFEKCHSTDSLNRIMYADIKTSLTDDLLALTDKMSMAASIECRAPFVDQELIELAGRIPSSMKIRGLQLKHLLKKVVEPWLPAEIIHRKKRGFGAPVGSWVRNELQPLVDDMLSESQIKKRGLFHWPVVQEIISNHNAQQNDHTDHLLALISLEQWCRIFLDGNEWRSAPETEVAQATPR
ncbi:MAG TPA: asparagine synthase (glutamine-hydrolyzing) [Candidatus Acidoferrum sp.]|nr:asparagine synthase (glutamine-hydrolyzing) [Candidatus Acidoferrum sp.]